MNQLITTVIFWTAIAFVVGAIAFLYFRKVEKLTPQEALRRAIKVGYQVWLASDFVAPSKLGQPHVTGKLLREAGLVLKAEVIGDSTYGYRMHEKAAAPHPELFGVDPLELAMGVQEKILGAQKS